MATYLADTESPICPLAVKPHFEALSQKEKLYGILQWIARLTGVAHYIARASWEGLPILAHQLSSYSPLIIDLLMSLFKKDQGGKPLLRDLEGLATESKVTAQEWNWFLEYSAQVLFNAGNYRSFGDSKFIPRLPNDAFERIVYASQSEKALALWEKVKENIYSIHPEEQLMLGYPADGHVSGYYSDNVSKKDIEFVQAFLDQKNISTLNTRMFKSEKGGKTHFRVVIASSDIKEGELFEHEGHVIRIQYGDFSEAMKKIAENMKKAIPFAANEHQANMLKSYVESFESGSIEAHKESQRHWIRDVGPVVESNIGFIETYRDPAGVRAEWEGFVACVNKEMTQKFEVLVWEAPTFIHRLPWPAEFEKDKFLKPDFTSLEVINFATTGTPPAGINIPNYDDIRQSFGFKNVSLGNVLNAKAPGEKTTFISENDLPLFEKYRGPAFEVQVGLHELLGHGSGKLLMEEETGKFNFDVKKPPLSPITGKPVDTWYRPGETWGSIFKSVASSYEECRAECVAMYLGVDKEILSIFKHEHQEADDVIYVGFLTMARAGLCALEFYEPKTKKWGQAHMQARYAILQVFVNSGLVTLDRSEPGNVIVQLNRNDILTKGVPAVGDFLMRLNVYKATADAHNGIQFYTDATAVDDSWLPIRDIVIAKKLPRKMFVQASTIVEQDKVQLIEYEPTLKGLIQSYVERNVW